jgi:hypothetical protein
VERAPHGQDEGLRVTNMVCFDYETVKCAVCGHKKRDGYQVVNGQVVCDECSDSGEIQIGNAKAAVVTERKESGVRALARISYKEREYVLDDRLWELRPVQEPWASIPLQSAKAARIISKGTCTERARYLY